MIRDGWASGVRLDGLPGGYRRSSRVSGRARARARRCTVTTAAGRRKPLGKTVLRGRKGRGLYR